MSVPRGRFVLAGALAGLVFTIGGMASAILIDLPTAFARYGVEPTAATALLHTGLRFGLGFATVVAYVGFRGAKPGHARASIVRTVGVVWFLAYVPGSVVLHELGVLTVAQLSFALVWGLGETLLATAVGSRVARADAGSP
ncbi:MAG: hypothetical protein R3195_10860 [Gemmatimonadota bacterium]|nr:hypothetical protein [Gemmatimonadota bacterium]